jgi:O-acetyl-ADP-ribose deacetylase (regulator of RNase III)
VTRHLAGLGDLPPGSAVLTPGGDLAAAYVLHLVVRSAEEPLTVATVRRALEQGLARVADWGLGSLTLPALGTGVGGLEIETAAALVADVIAGADAFRASGGRVVILVDSDYEREVFTRALT